jgi:hypothetical protein
MRARCAALVTGGLIEAHGWAGAGLGTAFIARQA